MLTLCMGGQCSKAESKLDLELDLQGQVILATLEAHGYGYTAKSELETLQSTTQVL